MPAAAARTQASLPTQPQQVAVHAFCLIFHRRQHPRLCLECNAFIQTLRRAEQDQHPFLNPLISREEALLPSFVPLPLPLSHPTRKEVIRAKLEWYLKMCSPRGAEFLLLVLDAPNMTMAHVGLSVCRVTQSGCSVTRGIVLRWSLCIRCWFKFRIVLVLLLLVDTRVWFPLQH